jgi:hypothetical protein
LSWSLALVGLLSTSSCSTLSRKRNEEAYGQVKSAAITAYIVKAQASNQLGVSLNTGVVAARRGGTSFYQKSEASDLILDGFRKALAHTTNWTVVSPAKTVGGVGTMPRPSLLGGHRCRNLAQTVYKYPNFNIAFKASLG